MIGIYKITNTITNKIYVGQALNIGKRQYNHFYLLNKGLHVNQYLQNSFNKYGKDCFCFEVLEVCSKNELSIRECYWVNLLKTNNRKYGYNAKIINENGSYSLSEETKKRISNSHIGIKHSEQTCKRLSEINKGKKHSDIVKEKMSVSQKNRNFRMSKEHKEKIINSNKLRKNNLSKETISKMSISKSKSILQYSLEDELINEFKSITEANLVTGINIGNISMCLMNKRKTAGKYKWILKQ